MGAGLCLGFIPVLETDPIKPLASLGNCLSGKAKLPISEALL